MKKALLFLFLPVLTFASLQKVSLQLEWKHQFEFAGFYAAKEKGYYKKAGLDVKIKEFQNNIKISDDVIDGKSTFGISSSSLILEKLQNKPVVLLASYFKQNSLALATKPDIKTPSDLKGKKIMAVPWEMEHTGIGVMLKDAKIYKKDYTLVNHDFTMNKFISGDVDAVSIFVTNQPYKLNKSGIKYNILNPANFGIYSYDLELFTSEKIAIQDSEMVKKFVNATNKGWEYAFKHKKEIVDLIYDKYTKRKSKAALMYEANKTEQLFKTNIFKVGSVVPELIKINAEIFSKLGLVENNYDFSKLDTYAFSALLNRVNSFVKLTQKEKKFIKKHPKIVLGTDKRWEPFVILKKDGTITGYDEDVVSLINKVSGLNIQLQAGDWKDENDKAKTRKIDGLSTSAAIKQRSAYLNFSDPYATIQKIIITSKENPKNIKNIKDLNGKTIAIDRYNLKDVEIAKKFVNSKILKFDTPEETIKAVVTGNADALFGNGAMLHLANKLGYTYLKYSADLNDNLELVFSVRNDWPEAISIINKSLKFIGNEKLLKLKSKWLFSDNSKYLKSSNIELTKKEKEYLKQKKKITMCIDPDWMPYESFKNGRHVGIAADYFKIFQDGLGIPIEAVKTKSWSESIQFAKQRKCDIFSLAMETPQRKEYMNFTTPYMQGPLVLATKLRAPFIVDFRSLGNKKIGIPKGYSSNEILRKKYPNLNIVNVESVEDGLEKVNNGEIFGFVGTLASVGYMFQKEFTGELKIAGKFDESWELGVGVRNDDKMLLNLFQKAVDSISDSQKKAILNKWIAVKYEKGVDYTLVFEVVIFAFLLLMFAIYWNRRLSQINEVLKKAKDIAENATAVKSNFLANMSHEIRTPMNAIVGMSFLIKQTELTKTQLGYIKKIETASNNLLTLLNDLLDFSKMEVKKLKLSKMNFSLIELLDNISNIVKIKADEKGLDFQVIYDENDSMYLYGDSLRIGQILINIVSNAIKFTDSGKVELVVKQISNDRFRFEVIDTGIGIEEEQIKSIFSPFTQADDSTTRKYGGTGLGLAISKDLVELMNGEIRVESEVGKGSRFIIEIELKEIGETINTGNSLADEIYSHFHFIEDKIQIDSKKRDDLFNKLKSAVMKRRPNLCEPIIQEFEKYRLEQKDEELFQKIKMLVDKYKFNEAMELLNEN